MLNSADNTLAALAARIASHFWKQPVRDVTPIVGKGTQNHIFVVTNEQEGARVVVRMSDDPGASRTYEKEQWCLAQAASHGVPGPVALALGRADNYSYLLLSFVEGVNGQDMTGDTTPLWRTLGQHIRRVHAVPVAGFGDDVDDLARSRPGETWQRFVDYNIESLSDDDPLRRLGVLTAAEAGRVQSLFGALKRREFRFGLIHGDIALRNIVVGPSGAVSLLDWGCAEAHIVPHYELIRMGERDPLEAADLEAFRDGYGLAASEFAEMQTDLTDLALLKAFDLTRWAIDRSPPNIAQFAARAQRLLRAHPAFA